MPSWNITALRQRPMVALFSPWEKDSLYLSWTSISGFWGSEGGDGNLSALWLTFPKRLSVEWAESISSSWDDVQNVVLNEVVDMKHLAQSTLVYISTSGSCECVGWEEAGQQSRLQAGLRVRLQCAVSLGMSPSPIKNTLGRILHPWAAYLFLILLSLGCLLVCLIWLWVP